MTIEQQLAMLQDWRVENPPPKGRTVTEHLQACADAGDVAARRILLSGLYSAGSGTEAAVTPTPIVPRELERERRIAAQQPGERGRSLRQAARPIVHSSESRPWLK